MPINFHHAQNRLSYTTRKADTSWLSFMGENVDFSGKRTVDIGCGGGIYTRALIELGAGEVTGVDFSEEMLKGAAQNCTDLPNVTFRHGGAADTKLASGKFDIVLERALIHHLDGLDDCFREAGRLLSESGVFIIQDRTPEDCLLPGDSNHIRGFFFEKYPRLSQTEVSRRHDAETVRAALARNGFVVRNEGKLWETRRVYKDFAELRQDLIERTGRSILHELRDAELQSLTDYIESKLEPGAEIIEKDCWTIWFARKTDRK